jgi:hypothetical protein
VSGGWRWGQDQGECRGGILGVVTETRGDLLDARPAQEADCGITQEGHHRRSLPGVQGALVLTEGDILGAMEVILNVPAAMHLKGKDCQLAQSSQS